MKYFIPLFESIPNFRKIVLRMFTIDNDIDFLNDCGYLKKYILRLSIEFSLNFSLKVLDLKMYYKKLLKALKQLGIS